MAQKSMEILTESMFYVLLALKQGQMCGIDIAATIEKLSGGRVLLGPATLYTILGKFEKGGYIREIAATGRKRTYEITSLGEESFKKEIKRLQNCIDDAVHAERRFE